MNVIALIGTVSKSKHAHVGDGVASLYRMRVDPRDDTPATVGIVMARGSVDQIIAAHAGSDRRIAIDGYVQALDDDGPGLVVIATHALWLSDQP